MSTDSNTFKLDVFWTAWSSQVMTRVLRDVLALERLTKVNRVPFLIGCDEILHKKLLHLGVQASTNFLDPDMVRVYVVNGSSITDELAARIPKDSNYEIVTLNGDAITAPTLNVDEDPYAGVQFYKDWHTIPETMPLGMKAPPQNLDPMASPLL